MEVNVASNKKILRLVKVTQNKKFKKIQQMTTIRQQT